MGSEAGEDWLNWGKVRLIKNNIEFWQWLDNHINLLSYNNLYHLFYGILVCKFYISEAVFKGVSEKVEIHITCGKKIFGIYVIIERLKSRMNLVRETSVCTVHTAQPEAENLRRWRVNWQKITNK